MNPILLKALIYGFSLGALFFVIAPLGLGISFIESLKPILVPGVFLAQGIPGNAADSGTLLIAVFLNGAVFTILFAGIFWIRKK